MNKLNKEELNDVFKLTNDMMSLDDSLRLGQSFFNALNTIFPELANTIVGTEYDTFYKDNNLDKCLNFISEKE